MSVKMQTEKDDLTQQVELPAITMNASRVPSVHSGSDCTNAYSMTEDEVQRRAYESH